jgi:beta-galactosidase
MMKTISVNADWQVRQQVKTNFYEKGPISEMVCLPHDAGIRLQRDPNVQNGSERGFFPHSIWEYTKKITIPGEYAQRHVEFRFEGTYTRSMVYINGAFAGQRPYGYAEFTIDADRFLKYNQENEIKAVVRTTDDSRWYTGAGLYRPVCMLVSSLTHFVSDGIRVETSQITDKQAVITVNSEVQCDGSQPIQTLRLQAEIVDENGVVVASDTAPITVFRKENTKARQRLYVKQPKLWDVDTPVLYGCRIRLMDGETELDACETDFGIRELSLDTENGLCVNGKMVKLRGACIHQDNGLLGSAAVQSAERRKVEKLKQAGFNALRIAHNPASRALLDACDRVGMLVMDEAFDVWTENKNGFDYAIDFEEWWERDIESMIAKDYNHPSVILYSIGNEIFEIGNPHGAARGRKIVEKIRKLDSTRYILNSVNGMLSVMDRMKERFGQRRAIMDQKDVNQTMTDIGERITEVMRDPLIGEATEEAFACVDIAGYNYMHGRYEMDRTLFQNRVICGSETHPSNIDRNWRLVKDYSHVIGDFTWTGWDYLGEVGIGRVVYNNQNKNIIMEHKAEYPWLTAWCGDIDIIGHRRTVSYYREIVFGLRKTPYIAVFRPSHYHDKPTYMQWCWTDTVSSWTWQGFEEKPIKVEVYSDADEVELLLNGVSIGRAGTGEKNRFKAIFDTIYRPGELTAVAYTAGLETGRHSLRSADGKLQLLVQPEHDTIPLNEGELAYINITLTDEDGNLWNCADRKVKVSVEGPAQLIALGSAKPDNTESYFTTEHTSFDGRLIAILRPNESGKVTVKIFADGCDDTVVAFQQIK